MILLFFSANYLALANPTINELKSLAEQGDVISQFWLGSIYANGEGIQEDDSEAVKWLTKAAKEGSGSRQKAARQGSKRS